jgi:hypothetical protein
VNYTTLFNTVKGYLENDFPSVSFTDVAGTGSTTLTGTQQINTFITQAEERIYNSVQIPALRRNVTGVTFGGNKYLSCPSDFLSSFSLAVIDGDGNYEYLLNKDVNFMRAAYPNPTEEGLPKYYSLFGPTVVGETVTNELSFILAPTPDDAYDVELHYYYYPQSITLSNTSWLGDNYDPVLLYGTLVEAYIFMKGEVDIITMYETKYKEALALAQRLGDGLERSDAYRSGQYRTPALPQNTGVL